MAVISFDSEDSWFVPNHEFRILLERAMRSLGSEDKACGPTKVPDRRVGPESGAIFTQTEPLILLRRELTAGPNMMRPAMAKTATSAMMRPYSTRPCA